MDGVRLPGRPARPWLALTALAAGWAAAGEPTQDKAKDDPASRHLYYTGGVHNEVGCKPPEKCVYKRTAGQPSDPLYPGWWTSQWTMYRVFKDYDKFPPPYGLPPAGLTTDDYEVSYGASYYDSSYVPQDGDGTGAMLEHYQGRCLPIFPMSNHFSCAFVSLGNKAYFLRYEDRPPGAPRCCRFSLQNHPPLRTFIEHLPYNPQESGHLGGTLQAYSRLVPPGILFGYAFESGARADSCDASLPPYRHPQSFYFAGQPTDPPDAPIVSQNYTGFCARKPDPAETWEQVARLCPAEPEWCCLFASDCPPAAQHDPE